MTRSILAALLGYVVIVLLVVAGTGVAWLALGAEGAFAAEGPAPSTPWMALNLMSGLIAAAVGGLVARRVGRSRRAVWILAGLVLVLGLAVAVLGSVAEPEPVAAARPVAEMGFFEAGRYAVQPGWYKWVIALIGTAGVLFGGRDRS